MARGEKSSTPSTVAWWGSHSPLEHSIIAPLLNVLKCSEEAAFDDFIEEKTADWLAARDSILQRSTEVDEEVSARKSSTRQRTDFQTFQGRVLRPMSRFETYSVARIAEAQCLHEPDGCLARILKRKLDSYKVMHLAQVRATLKHIFHRNDDEETSIQNHVSITTALFCYIP